jgi:hypothetical protein
MSRAAARFREADIARIFKAAGKAKVAVQVVIRPDGEIVVSTLDAPVSADGNNPWNEVLRDGQDRTAVRSKVP